MSDSEINDQDLLDAASRGDIHTIYELTSGNTLRKLADLTDEVGRTAFVRAARAGHLATIEALLPMLRSIDDWDESEEVQQAFEAAADEGHLDVARALEGEGADTRRRDLDEGAPCPICLRFYHPGTAETCSHWVCASEGGELSWFAQGAADFSDAVSALVSFLEDNDDDVIASALAKAPEQVSALVHEVAADGAHFWCERPHVITESWETDGMLSGAGLYYYHPEGSRFTQVIHDEATACLRFLEQNVELVEDDQTYLEYLWETIEQCGADGCEEDEDGSTIYICDITDEERSRFPELAMESEVRLKRLDDGTIVEL
jgi:hypothetical protein